MGKKVPEDAERNGMVRVLISVSESESIAELAGAAAAEKTVIGGIPVETGDGAGVETATAPDDLPICGRSEGN